MKAQWNKTDYPPPMHRLPTYDKSKNKQANKIELSALFRILEVIPILLCH